jgi:Protein of unknown function (DUF2911)
MENWSKRATEITFAADGTYTLFTIPTEKEWTIILNSASKQWGAYGYEKIKDKNVLEVKVAATATKDVVEKLTITAEETGVMISWDKTSVSVPVKF